MAKWSVFVNYQRLWFVLGSCWPRPYSGSPVARRDGSQYITDQRPRGNAQRCGATLCSACLRQDPRRGFRSANMLTALVLVHCLCFLYITSLVSGYLPTSRIKMTFMTSCTTSCGIQKFPEGLQLWILNINSLKAQNQTMVTIFISSRILCSEMIHFHLFQELNYSLLCNIFCLFMFLFIYHFGVYTILKIFLT